MNNPFVDKNLVSYFDELATSYNKRSLFYSDPSFQLQLLDEYSVVNTNGRVLDVGTGTGNCALYFRRWTQHVFGIDISLHMLAIAKGQGVTCACADASELPFGDRIFRVVICRQLLYYFDPRLVNRFLSEAYRVIQPKGTLLISQNVPFEPSDQGFLRRLMQIDGLTLCYWLPEEIQEIVKQNGFQNIQRRYVIRPISESFSDFCSLRRISESEARKRLKDLEAVPPDHYQLQFRDEEIRYLRRYLALCAAK